MPQPSNLPRNSTTITPITAYLVNWVHQPSVVVGQPALFTPITTNTPCAMIERSGSSWRKISEINFRQLVLDSFGDVSSPLGIRPVSIERFCSQIWVGAQNGYLFRSNNGGKDFDIVEQSISPTANTPRYVTKDISGRLWRVDQSASNTIDVYRENSGKGDADSWQQIASFSGYIGDGADFSPRHAIVVHPTNSDIVAFHGIGEDSFHYVWITQDAENFSQIPLPTNNGAQGDEAFDFAQAQGDIEFSSNGKLIVLWELLRDDDWPIYLSRSDDYETFSTIPILPNLTLDPGPAIDGGLPMQLFARGNDISVLFDRFINEGLSNFEHAYFARSFDGGETFDQLSDWLEFDEMPGNSVGIWRPDNSENTYVFFDTFGYEVEEPQIGGTYFQGLVDPSGVKTPAGEEFSSASGFSFPHSLYGAVTRPYGSGDLRSHINSPPGIAGGIIKNLPQGEVLCE